MGISLSEATELLLTGKKLAWAKYKDHKAGAITLEKPEQRRLLEFLLAADSSKVASGDEALFAGLLATWAMVDHDPAKVKGEASGKVSAQSWRLDRIEAFGFGGLTIFGGKTFDLYVGGNNWCLEGQNGSGKTSLVSAILWALTGKRIREHEGPVEERGEREDVISDDGTRIGNWPPLAAYPTTIVDLGKQAEVWVRLTFKAADGDTATAFRRMVSPPLGGPKVEEQIDSRLKMALRLAEISILMPARLTKLGFGKNSLTLYEAVKQLTGLDQLSDIADGCAAFGASNRKFIKYAKDQGIDNYERRFAESIASAKQLAEEFEFKLPEAIGLGEKDMDATLKEAARMASGDAGKHLETLKNEIPSAIDTSTIEGRNAVKTAVSSARGLVTQGSKAILLFQTWKALTDAATSIDFARLPAALDTAKTNLTKGLEWHNRQTADGKLRLKVSGWARPIEGRLPAC
jgi:hypothetical protein